MSSSGGSGSSFLKWQIALGLSAAGAVGLAYWYLRSSDRKHSLQAAKSLSLDQDQDVETDKEETPFNKAQRYKVEGNKLFQQGKYDEAIGLYNKAINTIPQEYKTELATYYSNRAAAYEHLEKWSAMIADCTKALELNNRHEKALFRRAKAEEMIKDWENALDDITTVCVLQKFTNQSAITMADRVLRELGKKNAAEAIKTRVPIIPSKNFIKTYFASFSEDPVGQMLMEAGDPLGQGDLTGFLKAKLAFATEKYEEVIPACTEEINMSESESTYKIEALSVRASFYFLTGQFTNSLEDLTTIIETADVDNRIKVNALIKRTSIYMQTERMEDCMNDFEEAARLGPNISDVFHHRGQVRLLMDKTVDAQSDFKRAVDLNPNFAMACVQKCYSDYRLAMMQQDVDKLMECMDSFRKAIERFPSQSESYIVFAQVKTEKQEFQDAEDLYQKALKIDPTNASIYVHRALLLLQWKGAIQEAVDLMREAIKVDEKCEFAYETLGTVEVQRENLVIAVELFNKAITLARSEIEMVHLFSLRDAAASQLKIATKLGAISNLLSLPTS